MRLNDAIGFGSLAIPCLTTPKSSAPKLAPAAWDEALQAALSPARRLRRPFPKGRRDGRARLNHSGGDFIFVVVRVRACVQLTGERIGIGRGTLRVSDTRGIPESANV
jgi:hypothetical protein